MFGGAGGDDIAANGDGDSDDGNSNSEEGDLFGGGPALASLTVRAWPLRT
jgi:hypothetical protein